MAEPRWIEIAESIRKDIASGVLRSGDRIPPENELVLQWGVSRMTVHRAMRELQRDGLVTRLRGRGTVVAEPKPRHSGQVALLFQHTENVFEIGYVTGIHARLDHGYQTVFCSTDNNLEREAAHLSQMRGTVDGIICLPSSAPETTPIMQSIIDEGTPFVCIDRIPDGLETDAVVTDNYGSSLKSLHYLLDQGHRSIAYVGDRNLHHSAARERYEAYLHTVTEIGIQDPERYVRWFPSNPEWEFVVEATHDALFRMMHDSRPPTAVFCVHDFYLAAVLEACQRMDLTIPGDLEILSFCDYPQWTLRGAGSVNRIIQQTRLVGETAADILKRRMAGESFLREVVRVPAIFHPAAKDS